MFRWLFGLVIAALLTVGTAVSAPQAPENDPQSKAQHTTAASAPVQTKPAEQKPTEPAEAAPTEPAKQKLTAAEAEQIALAHAGLTAEQVKGLHSEFDRDDRAEEYSVEFRHNGWEYDYEIEAYTGKILEWDKEFDD